MIILSILCFSAIESRSKTTRQSKINERNEINYVSSWARERPCKILVNAKNVSYEINFGNKIDKDNLYNLDINKIVVKNTFSYNQNRCKYFIVYCKYPKEIGCKNVTGYLEPGAESNVLPAGLNYKIKSLYATNYAQRIPCNKSCGIHIDGKTYKGCGGLVSTTFDRKKNSQTITVKNDNPSIPCKCRVEIFRKPNYEGRQHSDYHQGLNLETTSTRITNFFAESIWWDCLEAKSGLGDYFYQRRS